MRQKRGLKIDKSYVIGGMLEAACLMKTAVGMDESLLKFTRIEQAGAGRSDTELKTSSLRAGELQHHIHR